MNEQGTLKLTDGSRVAVMGGGPAGSFFAYFLLDMAGRAGLDLQVDIYEPRDFSRPGPVGCNMCAGIVSESLVQMLAAEGINLPPTVVQRGIDSYVLHMDVGSARIETPMLEKRIAATYRGAGPRDLKEFKWGGLDGHLQALAAAKGARVIHERIGAVTWETGRPRVKARSESLETYDLLAVTTGVNSPALKMFEELNFGYRPPETTKTYLREYLVGAEAVAQTLGNAIQVFLLDIPRLKFGMLIPKGDYITVCLLGEAIDTPLVEAFLAAPEVKNVLPPGLLHDECSCNCSPRINTSGAVHPYADRLVFIGDCAATRLYKDGIGSAYRAAKAAATTAVFQGVSAADFQRHYLRACGAIERDNNLGKFIFIVVSRIQKLRFVRNAMLRMILSEQAKAGGKRRMSVIQWDMYTGSGSYKDIFMGILHPAFWLRLLYDMVVSLFSARAGTQAGPREPKEAAIMNNSALGRLYQPGDVLLRQGEVGECMFVIQQGQVALVREQDGEEVFLGVRSEGEILGEMAIFEKEVQMATARALSPVRVLTVDKKNFLGRIHQDPSLAYRLFQLMSRRVRELSQQVTMLNQEVDRLTEKDKDAK